MKFIRNASFLHVTNNTLDTFIFSEDEVLGVVDIRSIAYYRIKEYCSAPFTALL